MKKKMMINKYIEEKEMKEYAELTFHPRLIAEEKLNKTKNSNVNHSSIEINHEALQKFYERMEAAKLNKLDKEKLEEDMIGAGKHWKPQLTVPEAPQFELKDNFGLEKVKCITKPVVRNGEIV